MPQPSGPDPNSTFIVRLRTEWAAGGQRWHGRIDHLESGERASFRTMKAMLAFIHRLAGWQNDDWPTGDEP